MNEAEKQVNTETELVKEPIQISDNLSLALRTNPETRNPEVKVVMSHTKFSYWCKKVMCCFCLYVSRTQWRWKRENAKVLDENEDEEIKEFWKA